MADIIGDLNNRKVVRMSHALNFARYDISIVALDIVYALIAEIKRDAEDLKFIQNIFIWMGLVSSICFHAIFFSYLFYLHFESGFV